jgi:hypothetical protein
MSKKTTATATATPAKQVEVLSIQDKKFIDVEMVDVMAQAHNAGLKRSELVFQVANASKSLVKDCTKDKWELVWADFENPKGTSKTAKHEQAKKANDDAIAKKYEHTSLENLKTELTQLIGLTDKNSVEKFKEVSKVVVEKSKEQQKLDEQNESKELKDFKDQYTTWFNGLLKTQEGRQELIALRLNKEVRAVVQKVLN